MQMEKIRMVIPARGGSKGLKNKHLQIIKNKPLIFWTIDQFIDAFQDDVEIYISTDCNKIIDLCLKKYNNIKILKRKPSLANDTSSTEEVLKDIASDWYKDLSEDQFVIYASACEINRSKKYLLQAVESLSEDKSIDTFMYGEKSHKHLWENWHREPVLMKDWMKIYSPRQSQESNFLIEHSGLILITKLKYWLDGKRFGGKTLIKELDESYRHIDIHNAIDLKIANSILN